MSKFHPLLFVAFLFACTDGQNPNGGTGSGQDTAANPLLALEQQILKAPTDPNSFAQRARYFEGLDSTALAINDWKRAMALDTTDAQWPIALADLYYRKLRVEEADPLLIKAIRLDPQGTEALLKRSELKLLLREYKEAMSLANDALRIDLLNPRGYYLKGWIHMEAGDTTLSISSYRTAVEQDPAFYEAYIALGLLHAHRREPLALQYYNTAIELRPESVEAWYNKGMYCQENGMDSVALACYATIKTIAPLNSMAYYNTGYILLEHQQRTADARREFARAIALLPDHAQAYYNRGLTFELDGKLDSALIDYQQALRLAPTFTLPAEGLGRLQSKGIKVTVP
jgi:tetratricopeptide (TPR) repeat protein